MRTPLIFHRIGAVDCAMPNLDVRPDLQLCYDTFGDKNAPALLLVMGLGAQMIGWEEGFCQRLANAGLHVIRFDNRDIGQSSWLDHLRLPDLTSLINSWFGGEKVSAEYTLWDMADDAVALLDALGIDRAHICGASMGGMIAQCVAISHPSRVRSLTSIMSTTSHPALPNPEPAAIQALLTPLPQDKAGYLQGAVQTWQALGGTFPFDANRCEQMAAAAFERGLHPNGFARQLAAILASGHRRDRLVEVKTPTLVVHGKADPLIPYAAGLDTQAHIAGAELLTIDEMGHDLHPATWEPIIAAMAALFARSDAPGSL